MFSQTPTPFVLDRLIGPILDGAVWGALLLLGLMIFLALVRKGSIKADWARRWFLDPVDRARAERAALEDAADGASGPPARDEGAPPVHKPANGADA